MTEELRATGNASSLHTVGRRARRIVEEAREQVAEAFGAGPSEVIFTSGGTEADNLAIKGLYWARRAEDPRRCRVLVSAVEHHAVLDAARWLGDVQEAEVVRLPVDAVGRVRVDAVRAVVEEDPATVALISVMWANNEVGTIQPVRELAAIGARHGIPVHSDAVQAAAQVAVALADSGLDAITLSAHKLGGPVGVGALLRRRGLALVPTAHGGGHESGLRSGTLDVAGIRGFAVAARSTVAELAGQGPRLAVLRDALVAAVRAQVPDAVLRGDPEPGGRLPGNAHLTLPGCDADTLLYLLDARAIACSTGSACRAGVPEPSHVLQAMGLASAEAAGALRFSFGWSSTPQDVQAVADAIGPVVARSRGAGTRVPATAAATPAASPATAVAGEGHAEAFAVPGELGEPTTPVGAPR